MVCEESLSTRSSKCSGSSALVVDTCGCVLSPKRILGAGGSSVCEGPARAEQLGTRSPSLKAFKRCIEFALSAISFRVFAQCVAVLGTANPTSTGSESRLRRRRDDAPCMCTACVNQHESLLVTEWPVAHEARESLLRGRPCNSVSNTRSSRRTGRQWQRVWSSGMATGSGAHADVDGGHGLVGRCQSAPIHPC